MKRLLTALILVPLALLAVFRAEAAAFTTVCAVIALLATVEYLQIVEHFGHAVYRSATYCLLLISFAALAVAMTPNAKLPPLAAIFVLVMIVLFAPAVYLLCGMRGAELREVMPGAALSLFALPYIGGGFAALSMLHAMRGGWFFVLLVCAAVWIGDSCAYYVGRRWGRHKFSPVISPNKSWEGAVASIVGAMIVVSIFAWFAPEIQRGLRWAHLLPPLGEAVYEVVATPSLMRAPIWLGMLIGAVVNIGAQLGDLFESMIKRGAGVKDSGTILPGHGGVLDRIDALLFAAPVALALFFFVAQWMVQLMVVG